MRLIMVARPAVAAMCNDAATNASADGRTPFDVPLRVAGDAKNTVRAYWCDWNLTVAVAQRIRDWMTAHSATAAETTVYAAGQSPPKANRIAIYDADGWTPDQVLTDLGVDRLAVTAV